MGFSIEEDLEFTSASTSLPVPVLRQGQQASVKVVGHFEFAGGPEQVQAYFESRLLRLNSQGGLENNPNEAAWDTFREFCASVSGYDDLPEDDWKALFGQKPRLKNQAILMTRALINQCRLAVEVQVGPLASSASSSEA